MLNLEKLTYGFCTCILCFFLISSKVFFKHPHFNNSPLTFWKVTICNHILNEIKILGWEFASHQRGGRKEERSRKQVPIDSERHQRLNAREFEKEYSAERGKCRVSY